MAKLAFFSKLKWQFQLVPSNLLPIAQSERNRWNAFKSRQSDGPLVKAIRWFFGCSVFHLPAEVVIRWYMAGYGPSGQLAGNADQENFKAAVEWYSLSWTAMTVWIWSSAWLTTTLSSWCLCGVLVWWFAFWATYRILEVLAVQFRLLVFSPYATRTFAHAVLLNFLGIAQVVICFATLYIFAAWMSCDCFGGDGKFLRSPVHSLYLSAVTFTTLGYGEFHPEKHLGQLIVVIQIVASVLMIVFAIQRTLSAAPQSQPNDD